MMSRHRRFTLLALSVAASLSACQPGSIWSASAQPQRGQTATLPDGRTINIRCQGRGAPTVIFESGFGAHAGAWGKVQPAVARTTRACAYDRAGMGLSDPGPDPRDGPAIARDLDEALTAAGIEGPYVLVGHSAGALYARLFAARRPGEVQGLVLLDPTVEQLAPPGGDGLNGIRRRLTRCVTVTETSPQPPLTDPAWEGCASARAEPDAIARARKPELWRNQLSELDSIFGRTSLAVNRLGGLLDDVPAYVLTASDTAAAAPKVGYDNPQSVLELRHLRLALGFHPGYQRTILSSHLVMNDRPDAVIEAVNAMVAAARAGRPPDPLPPSETRGAEDDPAAAFTR
ncbi:MAG: alpha/beta hydrolase [Pseudomonadota bacterium]